MVILLFVNQLCIPLNQLSQIYKNKKFLQIFQYRQFYSSKEYFYSKFLNIVLRYF